MFKSFGNLTYFIIAIFLLVVSWNIYLYFQLSEFKKHPEVVKIFVQKDDPLVDSLRNIQDSTGIEFIVPDYEKNQVDHAITVLNSSTNILGKVLTGLAIFVTLLGALGLYEINNWRNLRKEIEQQVNDVEGLKANLNTTIEFASGKRKEIETLIEENKNLDEELRGRVEEYQMASKEAREELETLVNTINIEKGNFIKENRDLQEELRGRVEEYQIASKEAREEVETLVNTINIEKGNFIEENQNLQEELKGQIEDYKQGLEKEKKELGQMLLTIDEEKDRIVQANKDFENQLRSRIEEYQQEAIGAQKELRQMVNAINSEKDKIIQENFVFKQFKENILEQFSYFHDKMGYFLEELKEVKDTNTVAANYSEELRRTLRDFFLFHKIFETLLKCVSEDEIPLESIDYFALGMAAYFEGDYESGISFFEAAIKTSTVRDHIIYYRLGSILYKDGNYTYALRSFEAAVEVEANFPAAHYNLGIAYEQLGKPNEAIKCYEQTIYQDGTIVGAYINLGNIYLRKKEYSRASEIFNKALKIDKGNFLLYYNRSCLYAIQGNTEDAWINLKSAFDLAPELVRQYILKDLNTDLKSLKDVKEFRELINLK